MRSVFSLQFFFKYPTLRKTHVRECKKRERGRRGEEKKCPSYGKVVCLSFSRGQGDWVSFCERRNGYRKCVSNLLIVDWMSVIQYVLHGMFLAQIGWDDPIVEDIYSTR